MDATLSVSKIALALVHSLCSSAIHGAVQALTLCTILFSPFLCLNGILFSFFLLKSLFFKPKFVENRYKTMAVDPGQNSSDFDFLKTESHSSSNRGADEPSGGGQANETGSTISNVRSMIQQLYTNDSTESEYIAPNNDLINLKEKIGSGFLGVVYKIDRQEHYSSTAIERTSKCAKLIDCMSLRQIINEVNGVNGVSGPNFPQTNLLKPHSKGSILMEKYLEHYRKFLEFVRKVEVNPKTRSSLQIRHPNVLFYDHVFVHDGKCLGPRTRHKKVLKSLNQLDKQQLPVSLLLIMDSGFCNLRSMLLKEWSQFSADTATEWGRQIGLGLQFLHQMVGVPHFNLKPENVLLVMVKQGSGKNPIGQFHSRYMVKISDCACGLLLPTSSSVLSQSDETSIYSLAPLLSGEKFSEGVHYDVHCFGMVLLLMLVGYESFGKTFLWSQFPVGLVSAARYRLVEIIQAYDRARIPASFSDLLRQVFSDHLTVSQLLKHAVFEGAQ